MSHQPPGRVAISGAPWRPGQAWLRAVAIVAIVTGCSGGDRSPGGAQATSEKIYQGYNANTGDVSWTGRIGYAADNSNHCTAALIAPGWAITAAHCLFDFDRPTVPLDPGRFNVSFGMRDMRDPGPYAQTSAIVQWMAHPNFSHGHDYDVALVRLATPMTPNPAVSVIALQQAPDLLSFATVTDNGLSGGESLIAAGWGATQLNSSKAPSSSTLRMTQMSPVLDPIPSEPMHRMQVCSQLQAGFCVKGVDTNACAGDSGGPLVRSADAKGGPTLVGIEGASNCVNTGNTAVNYAVYTNVSKIADWAIQTMDEAEQYERGSAAIAIAVQLLLSDD